MPQEKRSGPSPSASPAPLRAPAVDRGSSGTGSAPERSLAYDERPDFYGSGPARKPLKNALLACAFLAALAAAGFGLGSRFDGADPARVPSGQLAAADPRAIVSLVHDSQEEEKIRRAVKANEAVPQLAQAAPEVRAQVGTGERRVAFLRVAQPGERGDRLAVRVDGSPVGELDMSDLRSSVAVVYTPGQAIELTETVSGTGGAPGVHQFDAPDGQSFVMVKSIGAKVDWKGKIE